MDAPIEHLKEYLKDGGWKSRKFALVLITQGLMFGGAVLASKLHILDANYGVLVGGLLGALTVYMTGQAYQGAKAGSNLTAVVQQMTTDVKTQTTEVAPGTTVGPVNPTP